MLLAWHFYLHLLNVLPIIDLAGTEFHSSQNVINEDVTRIIPCKYKVYNLRALTIKLFKNENYASRHCHINFTRYKDCRKVKSAISRENKYNLQAAIVS